MSATQPAVNQSPRSMRDSVSMIDVHDPENIACWSSMLIVSPIELRQAVAKVGASSVNIRAYFGLSAFDVWPIQIRN